jgi:DNA-binding NarL/FixJ family response regulator
MVQSDFLGQFRNEELLEVTAAQQTQVLVLSDDTNDAACERFIRTGCAGVLPGNASPEVYRKAVQAISAGELWAPRRILSQLARESLLANNPRRLTARETEILNLLAIGYTNQDIADHLFLSRETVRWHLRSLYSKIGASDRTSAILYARQRSESTRT